MMDLYTALIEARETLDPPLSFDDGAGRSQLALLAAIDGSGCDVNGHLDRFTLACEVAMARVFEAA